MRIFDNGINSQCQPHIVFWGNCFNLEGPYEICELRQSRLDN